MDARVDIIDGVACALIFENKGPVALVARPDNNQPWTGDVVRGKIMRYAAAQRAFFAETDSGPVMVPHRSANAYPIGADVCMAIERPATKAKDARGVFTTDAPRRMAFDDYVRGEYPDAVITRGLDDYAEFIVNLRGPVVDCSDGINIVIEQTAAFVAVDVNAAAPNMTPLDVNRRAADALFRHMGLRNLQGQVVVDFLRLRDMGDKKSCEDHIKNLAATHVRPVKPYGFTRLGLFELTREKRGLSLDDIFTLAGI